MTNQIGPFDDGIRRLYPEKGTDQIGQQSPAPTVGAGDWIQYGFDLENTSAKGPGPTSAPTEQWRYDAGQEVQVPVTIGDGIIVAVSALSNVVSVDASDGSENWVTDLESVVSNEDMGVSLSGETAYVSAEEGTQSGTYKGVTALDLADGTIKWNEGAFVIPNSVPTLDTSGGADRLWIVYDEDAAELDPSDGATVWNEPLPQTETPIGCKVDVEEGQLYTGSDEANGRLRGIDASDGSELWTYSGGLVSATTPAVDDEGRIFLGEAGLTSGDGGAHTALDPTDGSTLWRETLGGTRSLNAPVVGADYVFFNRADSDNQIEARNMATGASQWTYQMDSTPQTPAYHDGVVYLSDGNGKIAAVAESDGSELWSTTAISDPGEPAVNDDTLYVGTVGGDVVALA